jgi:two-component system heavy metal sensor histidine kinase CusS
MRISIRQRLTFWYAAALVAGLCAFGLAMWLSLQQRLVAGVDARLAERLQGVQTALGSQSEITDRFHLQQELDEFAREVPDGGIIQLRDPNGGVILPAGARQTLSSRLSRHSPYTDEVAGRSLRIGAMRLEAAGEAFEAQVAIPLDETRAVMNDFRQLLFLLIPAVLIVSCLGGYWLSSRALRPVDAITSVAGAITLRNLSRRIALPNTGDELQRMAETWNQALERLEDSVKRIRQFTSDASHELRTPLALIRATAELALRKERDAEEYRTSLRQIEEEAGRMTELTESLLTLARADADSLGFVMKATDIAEVAHSVATQNAPIAEQRGIALRNSGSGGPFEVNVDPSGIRRLLLILVDNALRHTPPGGTITIAADGDPDSVTVSVEDTGEGIPADALPHVFERFYRADASRSRGSGYGLGLSIAQAIAQAHGSSLEVQSSPTAGTRFSMKLKK